MEIASIKSRCGKVAAFALAGALALGLAPSAQAADYNLNGATVSITTQDALSSDPYKGKTIKNGTLNVSANQQFSDGTIIFGSGLVLNQTAGAWQTSGGRTIKVVNGGVVNYTSTTDIYIGRLSNGTSYNGTTELALDNGTFDSCAALKLTSKASSNGYNKAPTLKLTLSNNSTLTLPSDKNITIGGIEQANSKKHNTLNCVVNVTGSSITANQFTIGQMTSYLNTPSSSANTITFGSGADLTLYSQMYAYLYPQPTVKFNGATIHYAGASGSRSFIGQNTAVTTDIYEIQSGGLTIDIPSGVSLTIDGNSSALKGAGGITKTGAGSITWNNITGSSPTKKMTFTGPFVVSNGTWTSTLGYAASAFRADGGNLTLSGALSASSVALSATDGGVLTLAGATLTDASPDLTLATGGSTDYFTRDGAVAAYTLDTFTLGAGGILSLDANATEIDAISATTTNVTATVANPAVITVNFLVAPVTGQTFTLFETDDAAKFTVNPKLGNVILPHETSVVNGVLTLTITADDYTWNGTGTNWGDTGAWTKNAASADWADGNNAIFATDGATVTLAANASASAVRFTAGATVSGSATLTVPSVSVVADVSATISAPTAGTLEKTGEGTLTLVASRTEQTTVTEGTFAMADGATVDATKLALGTDAAKAVVFDYGGQTLTANPATYVGGGMNVTLTNGVFTYSSTIGLGDSYPAAPSVLTVAADATLQSDDHFTITPPGEMTLNVVGGTMKSAKNTDNWMMQRSLNGQMNINVTDGGLLEFGGETYMLTCRDAVGGSTAYESPELHVRIVDSTFRILNGASLCFGYDSSNKNPVSPLGVFAATNSTIDVNNVNIGHNVVGANTAGSYTADFENCVITAKEFRVWQDRPLNNARLNNSRIVFRVADSKIRATDGDAKWITVDAGGLTIDNQSYAASLNANLGGSGAVTKVGTGTLTVNSNQTATAAFVCKEGETLLNAGLTVWRAVTVESNATFTVKATAQSTIASLAFESGATLNIDTPTVGVTPIAVTTSVTLPADGTVALKKSGGAFGKGLYPIVEKVGVTTAEAVNLVPETSGLTYEWTVQGNTLVLAVDMGLTGFIWTGLAGDGKMSTAGNWLNGTAPSAAGTDLDFSGVATATTVIGDIDVAFGTVTMGEGVITFAGDKMRATSFSDTTKVAVGANSTVTLDGDLVFSGTASTQYIVNRVAAGGRFVVTGRIEASSAMTAGQIFQCVNLSEGAVQAKGLVANEGTSDEWVFRLASSVNGTANWIIGSDGLSGSKYFFLNANDNRKGVIQPLDSDFAITAQIGVRAALTLNTTGYDGNGHVITIANVISRDGWDGKNTTTISGTGKVVVDAVNTLTAPVTVKDTATLAINAGKKMTSGTITFNSGTTLEVPSTGAANTGALAFESGANVTLKVTGSELAEGTYTVLTSTSVLATDIVSKFTLDASAVKGSKDAWLTPSGDGKSLVLNIGSRASQPANTWVGGSGTAFSTAANWANGVVPTSGTLDFSRVTVNTTINCGDLSGTVFDTANLGTAARKITIDGTLHLGTMTVTVTDANFSVAENSKLIIDGDVTLQAATSGALLYVVYYNQGEVEIGGKVVVNGKTKGYTYYNCSETATIAAKGMQLNVTSGGDRFKLNAKMNTAPMTNWIIGEDGLDATGSLGYWIDRGDGNSDSGCGATLHAATNFTISARIYARQFLNLDTGDGYTITVSGNGLIDGTYVSTAYNHMVITGSGRVVCDYVTGSYPGDSGGAYNGDITVTNTATLAINAGKKATTGAIAVNNGATLEVAQSGTVVPAGDLTLAAGAMLGFNYTSKDAPVLDVTGKTVTFEESATTNITVKISTADGKRAKGGANVLTSGGKFADATVTLAPGYPDWVKGVSVVDGNIVLDVKPSGTMIIVK